MSSFKSAVFQYIQTTFPKCRLLYSQCRHTSLVFLDSIPSLCLFPSDASSACSQRTADIACIRLIGAINSMHPCSILQLSLQVSNPSCSRLSFHQFHASMFYIATIISGVQSIMFATIISCIQFVSSDHSHSFCYNTILGKNNHIISYFLNADIVLIFTR